MNKFRAMNTKGMAKYLSEHALSDEDVYDFVEAFYHAFCQERDLPEVRIEVSSIYDDEDGEYWGRCYDDCVKINSRYVKHTLYSKNPVARLKALETIIHEERHVMQDAHEECKNCPQMQYVRLYREYLYGLSDWLNGMNYLLKCECRGDRSEWLPLGKEVINCVLSTWNESVDSRELHPHEFDARQFAAREMRKLVVDLGDVGKKFLTYMCEVDLQCRDDYEYSKVGIFALMDDFQRERDELVWFRSTEADMINKRIDDLGDSLLKKLAAVGVKSKEDEICYFHNLFYWGIPEEKECEKEWYGDDPYWWPIWMRREATIENAEKIEK